jgi:hypothetical protein
MHQLPGFNASGPSINIDDPATSNSTHELSTGGVVKITDYWGNADQTNFLK